MTTRSTYEAHVASWWGRSGRPDPRELTRGAKARVHHEARSEARLGRPAEFWSPKLEHDAEGFIDAVKGEAAWGTTDLKTFQGAAQIYMRSKRMKKTRPKWWPKQRLRYQAVAGAVATAAYLAARFAGVDVPEELQEATVVLIGGVVWATGWFAKDGD